MDSYQGTRSYLFVEVDEKTWARDENPLDKYNHLNHHQWMGGIMDQLGPWM